MENASLMGWPHAKSHTVHHCLVLVAIKNAPQNVPSLSIVDPKKPILNYSLLIYVPASLTFEADRPGHANHTVLRPYSTHWRVVTNQNTPFCTDLVDNPWQRV